MSSLLRRIKRPRRPVAADTAEGSPATSAPVPAAPEAPDQTGAHPPLPAGEDAADQRPTALRRGRLRKRLRFLERERELLLRDLGGLVYEIHRSGTADAREHHRALVTGKVERLTGLDHELAAGRATLGEHRADTVVREPGIGGSCPRCGEIHGSDARFCSTCGFPLEVAGSSAPPSRLAPSAAFSEPARTPSEPPTADTPAVVIMSRPEPSPAGDETRIVAPGARPAARPAADHGEERTDDHGAR